MPVNTMPSYPNAKEPLQSFRDINQNLDEVISWITIPNPSTYLPSLRPFPHPRPSLAQISTSLSQLRVVYYENNHDIGHDLPGRSGHLYRFVGEDDNNNTEVSASSTIDNEYDGEVCSSAIGKKKTFRSPSIVQAREVENAWEEEVDRVRSDKFELEWVRKWLLRWISYGSEWLEELHSSEFESDDDSEKDTFSSADDEEMTPNEESSEEKGEGVGAVSGMRTLTVKKPFDNTSQDASSENIQDSLSKLSISFVSSTDPRDIMSIVGDIRREQIITIEKLVDDASKILAACSCTTSSGAINRTFPFQCPLLDSSDKNSIVVQLRDDSLQDHESVGVQTWGSSVHLSADICNRPEYYGLIRKEPVKILEIGSGTGLVGLTAGTLLSNLSKRSPHDSLNASQVIMSDFHPLVLDNLKHNMMLNIQNNDYLTLGHNDDACKQMNVEIGIQCFDWEQSYALENVPWRWLGDFDYVEDSDGKDYGSEEEKEGFIFDLILGADIVYEVEHASWIAATVRRYLRKPTNAEFKTHLEPSFQLVFPLRPTHAAELEAIRRVFGMESSISTLKCHVNDNGPLGTLENPWNVVIVEERVFERQCGVGRADEMKYMFWRICWREIVLT